jgi:hypothetical protein
MGRAGVYPRYAKSCETHFAEMADGWDKPVVPFVCLLQATDFKRLKNSFRSKKIYCLCRDWPRMCLSFFTGRFVRG